MSVTVFPDIEAAVLDWLKAEFAILADEAGEVDTHVGADMPGVSLESRLPFVWARRTGGADRFFSDYPVVDIDVFGSTRRAAYDLSESIRAKLLAAPVLAGGVVIDTATTRTSPIRLPWDNEKVRRWGATYELSARRR